MPFGNYYINLNHLFELLIRFPKDRHQLTCSTLNPSDRQNFASVLRMCDQKVITLLRDYVEDSEATALYLQMLRDIIDCFMNLKLMPLQRVRKIWYPLFIIRIWRDSILSDEKYTLKDNFISANCYSCIELNAHNIVKCLIHLKNIDKPEYFLPWLYESQACESIFRQFRSFTTTYSTVANCTLKEAMSRISKIQFQNQIVQTTSSSFTYPRVKQTSSATQTEFTLPTEEQIFHEIENCHKLAVATAIKMGLIKKNAENQSKYTCGIKPLESNDNIKLKQSKQNTHKTSSKPGFVSFKMTANDLSNIQLKNYDEKVSAGDIDATSPYVAINCDSGKRIVVKKTSLCWLLGSDQPKMSSDRIHRVQYSLKQPSLKQKRKSKQTPKIKTNPNKNCALRYTCMPKKRKLKK